MAFRRELVLLSATPGIDVKDGKYVVTLTFGEVIPVNDDVRLRLAAAGGQGLDSAAEAPVAVMTLTLPLDSAKQYRIGSRWILEVNDDASITITPL